MARKKKGDPVSGWVCLDKPYDMTSTQAVGKLRWIYNAQKAGHAGTLDPLATGILPIALGEATKTVPFMMDADKTYQFSISWGRTTATYDREGETLDASDVRPSRAAIEAALPQFVGEILQVPPAFSAIKVDGERAYDLARAGQDVVLAARPVTIHAARICDMPSPDPGGSGNRLRQGSSCPRPGARPGPGGRGLRPCERPKTHPGRAVYPRSGDNTGNARRFAP